MKTNPLCAKGIELKQNEAEEKTVDNSKRSMGSSTDPFAIIVDLKTKKKTLDEVGKPTEEYVKLGTGVLYVDRHLCTSVQHLLPSKADHPLKTKCYETQHSISDISQDNPEKAVQPEIPP